MRKTFFDLTATRTYTARILRHFILLPLIIVACAAILITLINQDLEAHNVTSLTVIIFLLLFTVHVLQGFISNKLESDTQEPMTKENLACLLSSGMISHLGKNPKNTYALLKAACKSERGQFIRHEMGLKEDRLLKIAKPVAESQDILPFLSDALRIAGTFEQKKIDEGIIFFTFFQQEGIFKELLNSCDLSLEELTMIIRWEQYHNRVWHKSHFWQPAGLMRIFGGIGRRWVTGFNDALDRMTINISQSILYNAKRYVVIHKEKLQDAFHVLSRSTQHNIIVLGDHGIGKSSFVENIAYQLRKNELQKGLVYTRVLILKAQELLSGTENPDTFLLNVLKRANTQGHFILVIENIGLFLQAGDQNMRGVLAKFLEAKNINIIGIANTKDYHSLIKTAPALDNQFEKILLESPPKNDTMSVLMEGYFSIEDRQHVHLSYKALQSIIDLSDRYVTKGAFPGKAVDLMNDAVLAAKKAGERYVLEGHIRQVVSLRAHMDVTKMGSEEKDALLNLAERMEEKIVAQHYAIGAIVNALKRARMDVSNRKKPMGTFLFLGPTGVGKTQTAKVLAQEYFGKQGNMIRLDMNEYSTEASVTAITGSTDPKAPSEGFLTKQVQDKPFSLVLLDEIEKAHPNVVNLFLQILDEGQLINTHGVKTDFRNTIIIATSNAGSLFIQHFLKDHPDPSREESKKALIDEIIERKIYSPEFINRFDDVILYLPLTKEETVQIAMMIIGGIVKNLEDEKGITLTIEEDVVRAIAEKGYSPEFGAREMNRAVTDTLENYVAEYMLKNEVKRGDEIHIKKEDLGL